MLETFVQKQKMQTRIPVDRVSHPLHGNQRFDFVFILGAFTYVAFTCFEKDRNSSSELRIRFVHVRL